MPAIRGRENRAQCRPWSVKRTVLSEMEGFARLIGGIGLFLLGMGLLSNGLRLAAGPLLEKWLASATRTRGHALLFGLATTAIVQSSSAVTAAIIGFVNAGLMSLAGALWVIFGANVGTTMTGWLVALIGFKIKVEIIALPFVGIGMLLRLAGEATRRGGLGEALAGFGLLFLGIDFLRLAFADHAADFRYFPAGVGWRETALGVAGGLLLTVLMQSSSAAMVVILSAAGGGMVALPVAAAMVIGANIGTTVTALIAAIGATSNAKRTAAGHVLFNVLTGILAFFFLPWAPPLLAWLHRLFGFDDTPATLLAAYHTLFNVCGVVLMWPLADRLSAFLSQRFVSAEEDEARPRFLDKTVLSVPAVAQEALGREIARLGERSRAVVSLAMSGADRHHLQRRLAVVEHLSNAIAAFVVELNRRLMAAEIAERLAILLRIARYHEAAAEAALAGAMARDEADGARLETIEPWRAFVARAQELLAAEKGARESQEEALGRMEQSYQALKARLLALGANGELTVAQMDAALRAASAFRRALEQTAKAWQWQKR